MVGKKIITKAVSTTAPRGANGFAKAVRQAWSELPEKQRTSEVFYAAIDKLNAFASKLPSAQPAPVVQAKGNRSKGATSAAVTKSASRLKGAAKPNRRTRQPVATQSASADAALH